MFGEESDMESQKLYEAVRDFTIKAMQLLKNYAAVEGVQARPVEYISKIERGETQTTWQPAFKTEPDFSLLMFKHKEEIKTLPEAGICVDIMMKNDDVKKFHPRENLQDLLVDFVSNLLRDTGSFTFNKNKFDELYQRFEKDLFSSFYRVRAYTPLVNFTCGADEIQLGNALKIRKATLGELSEIWRQRRTYGTMGIGFPSEFVMELIFDSPKGQALGSGPAFEAFGNVVSALRLFKSSRVGYTIIIEKLPLTFWGGATTSTFRFGSEHGPNGGSYKLDRNEVNSFLDFWKKFRKLSTSRYLKRTIKRFNTALVSRDLEDKLVDLTIAFETLFRTKGYRLAHRASVLLAINKSERKDVVNFMDLAYRARSAVTHGGSFEDYTKREGLNPHEFIKKLENHLRKSIKFVVVLSPQNQKEFLEVIDNAAHDDKIRDKMYGKIPTWSFE